MASTILQSLFHPEELVALVKHKLGEGQFHNDLSEAPESVIICYHYLNLTSRSFAAVIQSLHEELRLPICIFYLVLRGLDTVEDDMTLDINLKAKTLHHFHEYLYHRGWNFVQSGPNEKDRQLLVDFHIVIEEFLKLKKGYQEVIADITKRMGAGMNEFCNRNVITIHDWNLYCHYVAGLVGIGLSRMFSASGLEAESVGQKETLSNSMGLFLQKTNIIRDYLEDAEDGRVFWPATVWSHYLPAPSSPSEAANGHNVPNGDKVVSPVGRPVPGKPNVLKSVTAQTLLQLKAKGNERAALQCLNHLIHDALSHVPDVLQYLSSLREPSVFRFCAIPQVMAIATLALCYNNHDVFQKVVKIRKGEAALLIAQANNITQVGKVFAKYLCLMRSKVIRGAPSPNPQFGDSLSIFQTIAKECDLPALESSVDYQQWALVSLFIFMVVLLTNLIQVN